MDNAVWQPGKNIEEYTLVCGENIAKIGAVNDVLECWKNSDPNWRSILCGNKPELRLLISSLPTIFQCFQTHLQA